MSLIGEARCGRQSRRRRIILAVVVSIIALVLVTLAGALVAGRLKSLYEIFWGYDEIYRVFRDEFNQSHAQAQFAATTIWLVRLFLWIPLVGLFVQTLIRRARLPALMSAFAAWAFFYSIMPVFYLLFGSDACFPNKWYVQEPNNRIALYNSRGTGFDEVGNPKLKVSAEICQRWQMQTARVQDRAPRIISDPFAVVFFDGTTGNALVWYYKQPDGTIDLFEGYRFHPDNGQKLLPVTDSIVGEAKKQFQDRLAKKKVEEKEAARKTEMANIAAAQEAARVRSRLENESRLAKARAEAEFAKKEAADQALKKAADERARRDFCEKSRMTKCDDDLRRNLEAAVISCKAVTDCEPKNSKAWSNLGGANLQQKNYSAAGAAFEEQFKIAEELKDASLLARAHTNLARLAMRRDALDVAETHYRESITLGDGSPEIQGVAYLGLSEVHLKRGDRRSSEALLNQAIELLRSTPNKYALATAYLGLGVVERLQNNRLAACNSFRTARALYSEGSQASRTAQLDEELMKTRCGIF